MKRLSADFIRPLLLLLPFSFSLPCFSQVAVDGRNTYERVLAVVPMVGAGTFADPRRPMFVPASPAAPGRRDGILAYTYEVSDDGQFALVELVARDRAALLPILTSRAPNVRAFEKGRAARALVEAEFRRLKRNFDMRHFGVRLP